MDTLLLLGSRNENDVFPSSLNLEEIRESIKGKREFKEVRNNNHIIISYTYPKGDSFPEPYGINNNRLLIVRRECRGLVLSMDGRCVLSRRYHKFFNVNEFPETHMDRCAPLDSTNHVVLEKLDGSMVSPWLVDDGNESTKNTIVWATKMGRNPVADDAARFVRDNAATSRYEDFVRECHRGGWTAIFEWCSRQRPVVLHYEADALICTAIRHKSKGHYLVYAEMAAFCGRFGVPVVGTRQHSCRSVAELVKLLRVEKGLEGCVLRYSNGEQIKLKTDWYMGLCRALQQTNAQAERSNERFVWTTVLDSSFDDVRSTISPDERDRLDRFSSELRKRMDALLLRMESFVAGASQMNDRAFAEHVRTVGSEFPSSLCFAMRRHSNDNGGWNALEALVELLSRMVNKPNGLEEARTLMGGINWDDFPLVKSDPSISSYSEWH